MSQSAAGSAAGGRAVHDSSRRIVAVLSISAVVAWSPALVVATSLRVDGPPRTIALILHILAMVLSFGAIMLVDWHGFLWLLGRRELSETIRLDGAATPLIWIGIATMLTTGAFLSPDLGNPLTVVKLVAVLVLILNGIMLLPLMRRLVVMPPTTSFAGLTAGHRIHMLSCLTVSQLSWWTAIIIGFVNAEF